MALKVLFSGFGGQGILFAGQLLARAALREGKYVSWVPSYGPEMRGGTAYCGVIVSQREISSPIVEKPDFLLAFNQPSLDKFAPVVVPQGTIILNNSLVHIHSQRKDVRQYPLPANYLAEQSGSIKAVNIVMLGALLKLSEIVTTDAILTELKELFTDKQSLLTINSRALETGYNKPASPEAI